MVNISDLDPCTLILVLWLNSKYMDFFKRVGVREPGSPTCEEIQTALRTGNNYINHISGRPIHVDFNFPDNVDTSAYNYVVGPGAFEKIVRDMRRNRTQRMP